MSMRYLHILIQQMMKGSVIKSKCFALSKTIFFAYRYQTCAIKQPKKMKGENSGIIYILL